MTNEIVYTYNKYETVFEPSIEITIDRTNTEEIVRAILGRLQLSKVGSSSKFHYWFIRYKYDSQNNYYTVLLYNDDDKISTNSYTRGYFINFDIQQNNDNREIGNVKVYVFKPNDINSTSIVVGYSHNTNIFSGLYSNFKVFCGLLEWVESNTSYYKIIIPPLSFGIDGMHVDFMPNVSYICKSEDVQYSQIS